MKSHTNHLAAALKGHIHILFMLLHKPYQYLPPLRFINLYFFLIVLDNILNGCDNFKLLLISGDIELNPGPGDDTFSKVEISICHINIRSIKAKFNGVNLKLDLIRNEIAKLYDIITISETWLTDSDNLNNFEIAGFQSPVVLNRTGHAGGVLCWVKNGIAAKRRTDIEVNNLEALWLEIRCINEKFLQ